MDGILIVDKPQGWTSHDVVNFVRKRFGLKKVGHAGTLDPIATGVLVILIGSYTKAASNFLSDDKEYDATLVLGAVSDTGDADGSITRIDEPLPSSDEEIRKAFENFIGDIEQIPPAYSAVKFKGRKLYEFARRGLSVEVAPRTVTVKRLDIISISRQEVRFKVVCSKGTYVRQLCQDIGKALGCGAHMTSLRRMRSGRFRIDEALKLDELKEMDMAGLARNLITNESHQRSK